MGGGRLSFSGALCTARFCSKPSGTLSGRCAYHEALESARWLQPGDFDRLREVLATSEPIGEDERDRRRARSALRSIEWLARDLKRAKRDARKAGATSDQVADAVQRGKEQAR
jgi:hypothetical protein